MGVSSLRVVDGRRRVRRRGGPTVPRAFRVIVWYPATRSGRAAGGPYPLVVFGHGFALTPAPYRRLLRAWARAGYVVAAPVFPGENAGAPGGPNAGDLVNQPGDVRRTVSRLLALDERSGTRFSGVIASRRIAVAGHSDGGDTALAVAYDRRFRDRRVTGAIVLAGAAMPGVGLTPAAHASAPLLAVQGTRDTVNRPAATTQYYRRLEVPRVRSALVGAGHLGPYFGRKPYAAVVERLTIAFLDRYVAGRRVVRSKLVAAGRVPNVARLQLDP